MGSMNYVCLLRDNREIMYQVSIPDEELLLCDWIFWMGKWFLYEFSGSNETENFHEYFPAPEPCFDPEDPLPYLDLKEMKVKFK